MAIRVRPRDLRRWGQRLYAILPLVVGVRLVAEHPKPATTLLVAAAVTPWLAFLAGRRLPRILTAALTFGATAGLLTLPIPNNAAPLFVLFLVGANARLLDRRASLRTLAAGVAMFVALQVAGWYEREPDLWTHAEFWSIVLAGAWLVGVTVQLQERVAVEQRRARREAAERAVVEERAHLARELHDAVGRSVAVMLLHVSGARRALVRDPDDAVRALELAEEAGRASMTDIRRTVGLLANSDDPAGRPSADDLPALVDEFVRAGMSVTLRIEGDLAPISPAGGLTLYRVVEESLTNASKHAPDAPVHVELILDTHRGTLLVSNPVVTSSNGRGGRGIPGMQQRARQLGGTLSVGPAEGQWRVELSVPLRAQT